MFLKYRHASHKHQYVFNVVSHISCLFKKISHGVYSMGNSQKGGSYKHFFSPLLHLHPSFESFAKPAQLEVLAGHCLSVMLMLLGRHSFGRGEWVISEAFGDVPLPPHWMMGQLLHGWPESCNLRRRSSICATLKGLEGLRLSWPTPLGVTSVIASRAPSTGSCKEVHLEG